MLHWAYTYPHKVYCSVLLLDGKIVDYKIGERYWSTPFQITLRGQITLEELEKAKTEYTYWEVNNDKEHQQVFNKLAKEWLKQFNK